MRKLLALATALLAGGLIAPSSAEARSPIIGSATYHTSGYHSCGCAIRTKKVFIGYDSYQRPLYRYHSVPTKHRCHHYRKPSHRYVNHGYRRAPVYRSSTGHYSRRGNYYNRSRYRSCY